MDIPTDVEAVLAQLFEEAREAFERGDIETGTAAVSSAATVASNKLPAGPFREQVLHGCEWAETRATEGETAVAAEYAAAMGRRLESDSTD